MTMTPGVRKLMLTVHVTSSVGWLGAVAAFLALAVTGVSSTDAQAVRAVYVAMEVITLFVIVPLALASLLSGIVQSLGSSWGLAQHYWVVVKLLVALVATTVLLLQLDSISHLASAAAENALGSADFLEARQSLVVHSGGGLLVLLVPAFLSVYKPRGRTRYGLRKQLEQRRVFTS